MEGYFGLIELIFFYSIAIVFALWQWLKMRREVREMRAERLAREAAEREAKESAEAAETTSSNAEPPAASDKAA